MYAVVAEQNGQCVVTLVLDVRVHRNFQGRKDSLTRTEGLDRAEGTMPGVAKVILSFEDNPLGELSSDSQLGFIRHYVFCLKTQPWKELIVMQYG